MILTSNRTSQVHAGFHVVFFHNESARSPDSEKWLVVSKHGLRLQLRSCPTCTFKMASHVAHHSEDGLPVDVPVVRITPHLLPPWSSATWERKIITQSLGDLWKKHGYEPRIPLILGAHPPRKWSGRSLFPVQLHPCQWVLSVYSNEDLRVLQVKTVSFVDSMQVKNGHNWGPWP